MSSTSVETVFSKFGLPLIKKEAQLQTWDAWCECEYFKAIFMHIYRLNTFSSCLVQEHKVTQGAQILCSRVWRMLNEQNATEFYCFLLFFINFWAFHPPFST